MCLICIELDKERLTFNDAWRNFREVAQSLDEEHKEVLKQKLIDKLLDEENKRNEDT